MLFKIQLGLNKNLLTYASLVIRCLNMYTPPPLNPIIFIYCRWFYLSLSCLMIANLRRCYLWSSTCRCVTTSLREFMYFGLLFWGKKATFLKEKCYFFLEKSKCHVTWGGVCASVTKWHMGEGGSKIGQKSVTYYLNGP